MLRILICVALLCVLPAASAQSWADNYDGYAAGMALNNVGGWFGWDNVPAAAGTVSAAQARSAPHSIDITAATDAVHPFGAGSYASGKWVLTAWQYIPAAAFTADTYFIVNNLYNHGGPYQWAIEVQFDFASGNVLDDFRPEANVLPICFDRWTEIRVHIDLDANTQSTYYGGTLLSTGTWNVLGGVVELQNIDLFTTGGTCYYDDLSIQGTWTDNYDGYAAGLALNNVGGWFGWDNVPAAAGTVSAAQARSAPHSIDITAATDAVHPFGAGQYASGKWVLTAWQHIPAANFTADTYFIVNNVYNHGGPYQWAIEVQFDFASGNVLDDFRPEANVVPIVFNAWTEIRVEIDLGANLQSTYYGGTLLSTGAWAVLGGPVQVQNIDLFTTGGTCYYDDLSLLPVFPVRPPIVDMTQSAPGAGAFLRNYDLVLGHHYYNIISADTLGAQSGGPFFGLYFSDPFALVYQLLLPAGLAPFNYVATSSCHVFGPFVLPPPVTFDAVCIDVTAIPGGVSTVDRITIL